MESMPGTRTHVEIVAGEAVLQGDLVLPSQTRGILVFAFGDGSGRTSPRNCHEASLLNEAGFGTLLFGLLGREEDQVDERSGQYRFDIELLASRLVEATHSVIHRPELRGLPVGYCGSGTGAAAALVAAARIPDHIRAIVSRGGRPDLAGDALHGVRAATLLIVGGNDPHALALNRHALVRLHCPRKLELVPGASHLFEERGAFHRTCFLTRRWLERYLTDRPGSEVMPQDRPTGKTAVMPWFPLES